MNMKIFLSFIFIFLFTLSMKAFAKTQQWYRVEMLIFEYPNNAQEIYPSAPGKPSLRDAQTLISDSKAEFAQLPDTTLALNSVKKRLQKNYRLVLHKGWRQTLSDKGHAQKIHLFGGKVNNAVHMPTTYEVDGTVLLSLGRHIYFETDLLLHSFRLTESSRIKPNEITYIDHPLYGILVVVIPENQRA